MNVLNQWHLVKSCEVQNIYSVLHPGVWPVWRSRSFSRGETEPDATFIWSSGLQMDLPMQPYESALYPCGISSGPYAATLFYLWVLYTVFTRILLKGDLEHIYLKVKSSNKLRRSFGVLHCVVWFFWRFGRTLSLFLYGYWKVDRIYLTKTRKTVNWTVVLIETWKFA
jgi:hypothetical protein